jgi:hypothetical protein
MHLVAELFFFWGNDRGYLKESKPISEGTNITSSLANCFPIVAVVCATARM